MTTIAYKDRVIAYDSRTTAGDLITSEDTEKKHVVNGVTFFMCGATSDYKRFHSLYFGGDEPIENMDASALVIDNGEMLLVAVSDDTGMWKQPMRLDNPCALGSGSTFALTAMDLGLSAFDAVKVAIKRDCKSGGIVRLYEF
jgi:ATP-dependent protease HslVU (ClpYQ) peptidase subunit